jgi:predicted small secreted protein
MLKKSHAPLIAIIAALAGFSLSGCNTVSGVGRDLQAAGRAMTSAAEDAKPDRRSSSSSQSAQRSRNNNTRPPSGPR